MWYSKHKKCEYCGADMTFSYRSKKYCSDAHRAAHWRERKGAVKRSQTEYRAKRSQKTSTG